MPLFKKILFSFLNSAAVAIYVALVAWVMHSGEKFSGEPPAIFGFAAFLLLFVLSAAIVSTLVFGWPIYLFFINEKKEAIIRLAMNLGWLLIITALVFTIILL